MSLIENISREAQDINLAETFHLLDTFTEDNGGVIQSMYPTINELPIQFKKSDRCFDFTTDPIHSAVEPFRYQHIGYGMSRTFTIHCNGKVFNVQDGAGYVAFHPSTRFSSSGKLWGLEGLSAVPKCRYRAMLPLGNINAPVQYMLGRNFKVGNNTRAYGLIDLSINSIKYRLYDYKYHEARYLFIESLDDISAEEFESVKAAIVLCYGLICGSWVQNEEFIFQSDKDDFSNIIGFNFRQLPTSISSPLELINPKGHKEYFQHSSTIYFPSSVFSKLVEISLEDRRIFRSVKLIVQAARSIPEISASVYCVALETIKSIIIEKNAAELQPIADKTTAKELRNKLKVVINSFPDSCYNDKSRLLLKIDNINQVGNTEGFYLVFEKLGIPLSAEEKNFLAFRNKFLHGEVPFDGNPDDPHQFQLNKISLHIHLLTCCLILKLAGYSGYVMNFWELWQSKIEETKPNDRLFKLI